MYATPKKHKVLVVEDDADIQQVLCFFLKHSNFDVCSVFNGQDAITTIPVYQPDLVILDIMMRPVSGWEVLYWLRDNQFTPPLPVLVLTAQIQLAEQVHGFEAGAVEYVTKPTQPSSIVERVRTILSLNIDQRIMLQRKRMEEQQQALDHVRTRAVDEFVYEQL